jgi:flagellar basal-body rod modification protein FlgD
MNIIHSIVNPLAALVTGGSNATSNANTTPATTPTPASNTLDANSFITLLTTELQSQDPLNPLDPTQFVDQLTSLNSLQQLIQIRTDLDSLSGGSTPAGTTGTGATGTGAAVAGTAIGANSAAPRVAQPNALSRIASALHSQTSGASTINALASLQALLNNSIATAPSAAAALYSKLGAQSKIF